MPPISRLTNNSDEADIASLISGDNIFAVPFFQRAYKWKPDRIQQFQVDLLDLVDESNDFHFLGAIIVHGRRSNPADPDIYEVIDGQQRLTTLYLLLCSAVKYLAEKDHGSEASALFTKYIVISRKTSAASNAKLHSCKEDRAQLNYVIKDLLSEKALSSTLEGFTYRPLPETHGSNSKGILRNNYLSFIRFLKREDEQGGVERIRAIYTAALNKMSVVQIDVKDPTSGPKIFDSLNSKQEPMTIGDLVRNEIFSRVADSNPDHIEFIDANHWQPFYRAFEVNNKNRFDSYFFPFGLTLEPNLRKSDVYPYFQKRWSSSEDPVSIVDELSLYLDCFIDLESGSNRLGLKKDAAHALKNLYLLKRPTSAYPFLLQLGNACKSGLVSESECVKILSTVESFLVRRAVCGHEPTGLHAVFKRLWRDCCDSYDGIVTARGVIDCISKHKTVVRPNDDDVVESVRLRKMYGSSITRYILAQYDISLGGDCPSDFPHIEHVLPTNPDKGWFGTFPKDNADQYKDRLANLIPLSQSMNGSIQNSVYETKRDRYIEDAMYKSARDFGNKFEVWTPDNLERRSNELAAWAIKRWPFGTP